MPLTIPATLLTRRGVRWLEGPVLTGEKFILSGWKHHHELELVFEEARLRRPRIPFPTICVPKHCCSVCRPTLAFAHSPVHTLTQLPSPFILCLSSRADRLRQIQRMKRVINKSHGSVEAAQQYHGLYGKRPAAEHEPRGLSVLFTLCRKFAL